MLYAYGLETRQQFNGIVAECRQSFSDSKMGRCMVEMGGDKNLIFFFRFRSSGRKSPSVSVSGRFEAIDKSKLVIQFNLSSILRTPRKG
jgi:hypothetical protein